MQNQAIIYFINNTNIVGNINKQSFEYEQLKELNIKIL